MTALRPAQVLALLGLMAAPFLVACSGNSANVGDDTSPVDDEPSAGGASSGGPGAGGRTSASGGAATSGGATASGGAVTAPIPCGKNTCGAGEFCCNASCGICAPEGGECTLEHCPDPEPARCGDVLCAAGLECCNESCGICVPPGGSCSQQLCEEPCGAKVAPCDAGFAWSNSTCGCVPLPPPPGPCQSDAECFLVDDYCEGCNCRALTAAQTLPACETELYQCLQAPCAGQRAACMGGMCTVVAASR
jgi:hypothetical protein